MLSIEQIEHLVATEYSAASAEVHAVVAWIKGKDNEIKTAVAQLAAITPVLQRAGYTINVTPPAAA